MNKIITEITPLSDKDLFYLVDRTKDGFTYPIHRHKEYELNFIENAKGATRVVGDSLETIGDYDLCLVGHGIEHGWLQGACTSDNIRETTIQFSESLFGQEFLNKNQVSSIKKMFEDSSKGILFSMRTIMKVYSRLEKLIGMESGFDKMLEFMSVLYELSLDKDSRRLSSSSFANVRPSSDSRRVSKVQEYVDQNYMKDIHLEDLASIAGMTATAFSRFFKLRTGKSVSDFIIDIRLGHATRKLMDSSMSVAEISYECGFNNISNFNRIFKRKKGCTPKEFRDLYHRHKTII